MIRDMNGRYLIRVTFPSPHTDYDCLFPAGNDAFECMDIALALSKAIFMIDDDACIDIEDCARHSFQARVAYVDRQTKTIKRVGAN